jgi:hypothetical protein
MMSYSREPPCRKIANLRPGTPAVRFDIAKRMLNVKGDIAT